jgi:peptidoglycan/xylan/chitin deacetylase (PgdA/CDA1 family)
MYHNVGWEPNDRGTITPEELAAQWRTLVSLGFRNVTMAWVREAVLGERPLQGRNCAITFDDGRSGVVEQGLGILQEFGWTATVYLVPGFLGQTRHFSYAKVPPTWIAEREFETSTAVRARYMRETDVAQWLEHGHSIGSHTMSHQHLPGLSPEQLGTEIEPAARSVERLAGNVPGSTDFAYPYGEYNLDVAGVVAGEHRSAVTTVQGAVRADGRVFEISRFDPGRRRDELVRRLYGLRLL